MARLATILARGGSKGVPGKNVRLIAGAPLIAHSVRHAVEAGLFDAIAVSSDADDILEAGRAAGATHLVERPAQMATDEAGKLPAIRHCVAEMEMLLGVTFETITDLQPTSPTRLADDIRGAVDMQARLGVSNVISGSEAKSSPYFNLVEERADGSVGLSKAPAGDVVRRQDAPRCFDLNGSIYVWRRDALMEGEGLWFADTHLYEMPPERSVDIDTELDFRFADFLMSQAGG
ncbi:cytidylyltransferase domain-containing protein [Pyruvatibacter mobilis]|uniref:acylneuraminate cytidylyltransferase family protein n=1 Tax=Pyruvatibacter mobilis TaxID=1712261 RepID=UPI003BA8D1A9